jgi:hypothetical protein
MTVQLGNDNASNIHSLSEGISLIVALLPDGAIHYEDNLVRAHSLLHLLHLIKQFRLLLMPSRGIHNDDFNTFLLEFFNTFLGDGHWISLRIASVERYSNSGSVLF